MTDTPEVDNTENVRRCKQSIIQFIEAMPDDEFAELIAVRFIDGAMGTIFAPLNDSLKNMFGGYGNKLSEEMKLKRKRRYAR